MQSFGLQPHLIRFLPGEPSFLSRHRISLKQRMRFFGTSVHEIPLSRFRAIGFIRFWLIRKPVRWKSPLSVSYEIWVTRKSQFYPKHQLIQCSWNRERPFIYRRLENLHSEVSVYLNTWICTCLNILCLEKIESADEMLFQLSKHRQEKRINNQERGSDVQHAVKWFHRK